MNRRAALLLLCLVARQALAQEAPAESAGVKPAQGGIGSSFEDLGTSFFSGVAACRSNAYPGGDPELLAYKVTGRLLEPEADVRALLDAAVPWTKKGRPWSEDACTRLRGITAQLRYDVEIEERTIPGGVELALALSPVTLVRYIDVSGNLSLIEGLLNMFLRLDFSPVYKEDIERRMRLRPGSALQANENRRRAQLDEEKDRIVEYLARRGYFDADVKIKVKPHGEPYEVTVEVDIDKGKSYTVGKIAVAGSSAIDDFTITEAMAQRVCLFSLCLWKDRFSFDELKEDREKVRTMFQDKGYPGVRVATSFDPATSHDPVTKTVFFGVTVEERKKITVAFQGNQHREERNMRALLTFNTAGAYDDFEAQNSAEAIRRAYQGDGRFLTTIQVEREKLEPSAQCPDCKPHDAIVFHIDEGQEQKIRGIAFRGNKAFTADQLREHVTVKEFPSFEWAFEGGGYVTSLQLQQDLDRIVDFYKSEGFPDAAAEARMGNDPGILDDLGAVAAMLAAEDRGRGLYIVFDVLEGERDVVEELAFEGAHALGPDELVVKESRIRTGKPFTQPALDADLERIRRLYLSRGYLNVKLTPVRSGAGAHTRVRVAVDEGVRARTGKVIIRGNFKTKRWVIADAVQVHEGETLSVDGLESTQASLRATELFASVRAPSLVGTDPVNLIFDVDERFDNKFEGDFGGGYSTDNGPFLAAGLGLRNIGGIGVSLTANGEGGLKRTRAQATLSFPQWVMRRALRLPMKLDFQGRYTVEDTPRFGNLQTIGGSAVLSRQLAGGVSLSMRYDLNLFNRSTELLRPPGADSETSTSPIKTRTASLGPILLVDRRRPTAFMPSSGFQLQASVALASRYLLGTDDFVKLGLAGQLFLPLGKRAVLTNTVRYDEGFPLGGAVLLPEVERFTAGGDTTVRGLEQDRLATEIIANPLSPAGDVTSFRVVPAGGNIRFLHKLDLQVRMVDIGGGAVGFASAIFLDTGFITNSFERFDIVRKFRHSVGIAFFRLVSPFGSASFEYAVPLDPEVGDDPTGRLHLNVGFVF